MKVASCPTGRAVIQVEKGGQNAILLYPGANAVALEPEAALKDCGAGDWLLLQNETAGSAAVFQAAVKRGMKVAVNPSPFDGRAASLPLNRASCLLVNEGEGAALVHPPAGKRDTPEAFLPVLRALRQQFPPDGDRTDPGRAGGVVRR